MIAAIARNAVSLVILCSLNFMGIPALFAAGDDEASIAVNLEVVDEKVPCWYPPEFIISVTNLSSSPVRVVNIDHEWSTSMKVYHLDSMQDASGKMPGTFMLYDNILGDEYYTELEEHDSIQLSVPTELKGFQFLPPGKYLVYARYVTDPFAPSPRKVYESNKITYEVVGDQKCTFISFADVDDPSVKVDLHLDNETMACGTMPELTLSVTNLTDSPVKVLNIASRDLQRVATRMRVASRMEVYHDDSMRDTSADQQHYSTDPELPNVDDSDYMELKGHDSTQFELLVQDIELHRLPPGKYLVYIRYVTDPFSPFPRDVYESNKIEYEVVDSPKCPADGTFKQPVQRS